MALILQRSSIGSLPFSAPTAPAGRLSVQFGLPERRMVGMYHTGRATATVAGVVEPAEVGVLMCNPFGQEAIRSHRVYVVLADRLAALGVPTLRFDYVGSGDSAGDDLDADLHGWRRDILEADAELRRRARPKAVVWLGLRLGATAAALASGNAAPPPDSLILWDPVIDGAAYLRELAEADRAAVLQGFSANAGSYRAMAQRPPAPELAEALGFAVSPAMRAQMAAVDPAALARASAGRCTVIASRSFHAGLAGAEAAAGNLALPWPKAALRKLDLDIGWASNDSGGKTIAPMDVIKVVLPAVMETSR